MYFNLFIKYSQRLFLFKRGFINKQEYTNELSVTFE